MSNKASTKPRIDTARPATRAPVLQQSVSILLAAIPIFLVAHQLHMLGSDGLWLPMGWRRPVEILAVLLGVMVFHVVRSGPWNAGRKKDRRAGEGGVARHLNYRRARWRLVFALLLTVCFVMIEQASMYSWPQCGDWVRENFGLHDQSAGLAPTASGRHAKLDYGTQSSHAWVPDERLPPFIDQRRYRILIPPELLRPSDLNRYFDQVGKDPQNAGQGAAILQVLEREPDRIIDALRGLDGKWGMNVFAALITLLYVMIMWLIGATLGYSFRPGTALGEWLASRFATH